MYGVTEEIFENGGALAQGSLGAADASLQLARNFSRPLSPEEIRAKEFDQMVQELNESHSRIAMALGSARRHYIEGGSDNPALAKSDFANAVYHSRAITNRLLAVKALVFPSTPRGAKSDDEKSGQ